MIKIEDSLVIKKDEDGDLLKTKSKGKGKSSRGKKVVNKYKFKNPDEEDEEVTEFDGEAASQEESSAEIEIKEEEVEQVKNLKWTSIDETSGYADFKKYNDMTFPLSENPPQLTYNKHTPYQIFSLFMTENLYQEFADSTNRFIAKRVKNKSREILLDKTMRKMDHYAKYIITANEIKTFLGIILYMNFHHLKNYGGIFRTLQF